MIDGLSDHSQIELEAVESYERSHKTDEPVLDKLRYMRGSEPLPGYDALSVEEIVTALERGRPGHDQEGPRLRAQVRQSPRRLGGGRPRSTTGVWQANLRAPRPPTSP